jgi:hypothetical protein
MLTKYDIQRITELIPEIDDLLRHLMVIPAEEDTEEWELLDSAENGLSEAVSALQSLIAGG